MNDTGSVLVTVFLKHDQSRTIEQIKERLEETGFWAAFPPEGMEVVSWYVMMGIGQVATVRVPVDRVREFNMSVEKTAWSAFTTEFYLSYDFVPVWQQFRAAAEAAGD